MKKLVIAEKPSLARAICQALAQTGESFHLNDDKEYYISENYYVVGQFGHLLELIMPEEYPENKGEKYAPLPYFPEKHIFRVKNGCEKRYETIEKLIHRNDVSEIIHCGDADREGQLLVDLVLEKAGNSKPVTRPQFKALTPGAICAAFKKRSNNAAFVTTRDEGYARMVFDFDYGINLSNYATRKAHARPALNVGRVKGAILSEIYNRDMAIKNFKPETFFKVVSKKDGIKLTSKEKFDTKPPAAEYAGKLQVGPTVVKDITEAPVSKKRPKLFSQTKLQAFMSERYGYSPDRTLEIAQSLYEKGLTTYPRTNTEYMTDAEKPLIKSIINTINKGGVLEFRDEKSVFDDSKVDSHSAIIITGKKPDSLPEDEMNCFVAIFNRFRAVFCKEPCVYNKTTVIIENPLEFFKITGETLVTPGWQTFEPPSKKKKDTKKKHEAGDEEEDNAPLPKLEVGQVLNTDFQPVEGQTKPPAHYTVATLGTWMENPFKKEAKIEGDDDDAEDYKNILAGLEIGTEATRAGIIKQLQDKEYISLKKSTYRIEPRGEFLVNVCRDLGIDMSKEKTATMGKIIKDIGKGKIALSGAIEDEQNDIAEIIAADKTCKSMANEDRGLGMCPICGKPIIENKKAFGCSGYKDGCKFTIWKTIAGKTITKAQAKKLIETGMTNEIKGFKSKAGKEFNAKLKLNADKSGVEFEFANRKQKN